MNSTKTSPTAITARMLIQIRYFLMAPTDDDALSRSIFIITHPVVRIGVAPAARGAPRRFPPVESVFKIRCETHIFKWRKGFFRPGAFLRRGSDRFRC